MPYIANKLRALVRPHTTADASTPGELNYQISHLIDIYLRNEGVGYEQINAVVGVLECAKLELYRRIAAPYENVKRVSNGDVYTCV